MKETKLILILLFTFLCSIFPSGHQGLALAASVEETCTGEDDTCASGLTEEDSSDDEEYEPEPEEVAFDGDCEDDDESCTLYANQGACASNPGFMQFHCPKSCNTCADVKKAMEAAEFVQDGDGTVCTDDHYQCSEWAGMGECDANPNYMLTSCRRSCVVCFAGTNQFGVGQRIPRNQDKDKAVEYVEKSAKYMQRVWKEEEFSRVRHKCRNQHEDCTYWASLGECEANPKYMHLNCAPACETCDQLDIRHRCPIEPENTCIWKPGDLNTLFENIADNADGKGEYLKYNPKALSRPKIKRDGTDSGAEIDGPWIVLFENFVTEEEADRLIDIGQKQGYERSADVGKEKPDGSHEALVSETRTSHNTWCQLPGCFEDPLVEPVIERIANVTKTEVKNSEYLQLLQYEPGQYYKQVRYSFILSLFSFNEAMLTQFL